MAKSTKKQGSNRENDTFSWQKHVIAIEHLSTHQLDSIAYMISNLESGKPDIHGDVIMPGAIRIPDRITITVDYGKTTE